MNIEDLSIGIVVKMKNLKQAENEVNTFGQKVANCSKQMDSSFNTKNIQGYNLNLKKLRKNIGLFIGSLFTVRGIWFALRKSMTTYLAQNEELRNKMNAVYYAVGSLFAPLLEYMVNGLIKIVSYIDIMAKAMGLAGINMKNFNKNATAAKKTLLGIDEISNLNSNENSALGNPFADVELNQKWVDIMKGVGEKLKPLVDWFKTADLKDIITTIGLLVGAYEGLKLAVKLLTASFVAKNTALGIQAGLELGAIGTVGLLGGAYLLLSGYLEDVAKAFGEVKQKLKEWMKYLGEIGNWSAISEWLKRLKDDFNNVDWEIGNSLVIAWDNLKLWVNGTITSISNWATVTSQNILSAITSWATSVYDGMTNMWENLKTWLMSTASAIGSWASNTATSIGNWAKAIVQSVASALSTAWENFKNFMSATGQAIKGWWSGMWSITIPALTIVGLAIGEIAFQKFMPKAFVPAYATGTNYVPNDQLAMVHQGEAIVPKRFNSKEFFGQASVEELNLLSSINEQLEELNSKNYTIELDGENVAKKVSKSMQQLTNRNGVSVFEVAR